MTTDMRNKLTTTMIGDKNDINNLRVLMGESEFPKNEIRPINGIIMKKLLTIKFRVISSNSINTSGSRGDNLGGKKIGRHENINITTDNRSDKLIFQTEQAMSINNKCSNDDRVVTIICDNG